MDDRRSHLFPSNQSNLQHDGPRREQKRRVDREPALDSQKAT
jgi:hypothetical protein